MHPSQKKDTVITKHIQKYVYYALRTIYKEFLKYTGENYEHGNENVLPFQFPALKRTTLI